MNMTYVRTLNRSSNGSVYGSQNFFRFSFPSKVFFTFRASKYMSVILINSRVALVFSSSIICSADATVSLITFKTNIYAYVNYILCQCNCVQNYMHIASYVASYVATLLYSYENAPVQLD